MCVTHVFQAGEDMVSERQLQSTHQSNAQAYSHGHRPACRKVSEYHRSEARQGIEQKIQIRDDTHTGRDGAAGPC